MNNRTPRGLRLHIALFGRRNTGKSSLLNAFTQQSVSIVSDLPGTTTDPVEKPMELLPLGPVLFIDTAGIDDAGVLGDLRIEKTRQVLDRTDLALLICSDNIWGKYEEGLLAELRERQIASLVVHNKSDLSSTNPDFIKRIEEQRVRFVEISALTGLGLLDLRQAILDLAPAHFFDEQDLISDIVGPGELALLVVPLDKEAPRGRLIVPQVQTIRNLLDNDCYCLVVKERELRAALNNLIKPPRLVVTDSQAFLKVAADTPKEVLMTSFSVLFARLKGDLPELVRGACMIGGLQPDDAVLIAETCSHHPIAEDIGRVKIPRWLRQYVGGKMVIEHCVGHDLPSDLSRYKLVIHCGACMWNRKEMLGRIWRCRSSGTAITNYGLAIAYCLGLFERALSPFPAAYQVYSDFKDAL